MKILIIKLGALGDIIMSSPIIKRIQEHYVDDEIWLLTTPEHETLFSGWEKLNIKTFKRSNIFNTLKTINWIRKNKFGRLYDLQSNDRTTFLSALSSIPVRAGNHPRFPYHLHPKKTYKGECHSFDRLNQILTSAKISTAQAMPYFPTSDMARNKASTWLNSKKLINKSYVLMHAGSSQSHQKKRWPYYAELAKILTKNNLETVWIGSDDDVNINAQLSNLAGLNATNQFTVPELVELGKKAKFAITNDSAPMHILSCSQIPVFGLFGPTYARRTHALGQLSNVITPNNNLAKDDDDFEPQDISNITVEKVLKKLNGQKLL